MEAIQSLYLNLLGQERNDVLKELLHSCVDEICGHPGPSYRKFMTRMDWRKEEYEEIYRLITTLLRNPTCLYLMEEKMPSEYHDFPEPIRKDILTCLKVRRKQLTRALLAEHSKQKLQTLVDFDWRLKLVMGTSKLASLREPLLQLDFITEHTKVRRVIGVEMNKDELDMLITTMETLVMGTSKLASLREPLLQLDFITEHTKVRRVIGVEMNKDELDMLITTMETVVQ